MSIRDDFFAAKAKGSLWDVAVSIKRGNPLPLDADSIFESYSALETYAADVLAYPGQVVAVVEESATTIYYLDQTLAIKPVGVIPTGDGKTIEVTSEGAISLLGAATAPNGTLPMIDSTTGKLVWKTLEDIGAGDGNDNTTYAFSFADQKITVTPSLNGVAQESFEIDLSAFVTESELTTALNDYFNNRDKDTTYSVKADEKIIKLEGTEFSSVLSLGYSDTKIKLLGIDGAVVSELDASAFVADGVLEDVDYDAANDKLIFTWNTIDSETNEKKKIEVDVADLVDTYAAGNGLALDDHTFSVKVADSSESFLSVDAAGIKLSGVQTAINTAKQEAIDDAADKYATKEFVGEIPSTYSETNVIAYINKKAQEVLDSATGGSSESAASVKQQLDTYKTENDPKVRALLTEVWGSESYTGDSRIDALEAVGAQANVIEEIQKNGTKITPTGKVVNIEVPTELSELGGYNTIDNRITTAKEQADKGVSDASTAKALADDNAERIGTLETKVSGTAGLEAAKQDHETRILKLEKYDTDNSAAIDVLEETITTKADKTTVNGLASQLGTAEGEIATLKTKVASNEVSISNKADASNVYTKDEINAKTGTIPEDKTLVGMITEVSSTMTTSYATKASVENIYKVDGETITGVLADEITRAKKAESDNATAISTLISTLTPVDADKSKSIRSIAADEINTLIGGANSEDTIESIKSLVDYVNTNGSTLAALNKSVETNTTNIGNNTTNISNNTTAIGIINDKLVGVTTTVSDLITAKIEAAALKASTEVTITNGVLGIGTVSTDKLVQGSETLVLNGGTATK